ncbi:MAG: pyridoxamine 5'-phosphate oxidase family protein [Terriglobales bacterium]
MAAPKRRAKTLEPKTTRPLMPGYGLPENTKGLLPWKWAEQRLKKSHNYWITTVKPDGAPHTMVVWGLWLDGAFLFSTGSQSRKARNLAANQKCVVCNEDAHEAVIVEGTAGLAPVAVRREFLKKYQRKYDFDMATMEKDILSMKEPVFSVRPRLAFGLYEKKFMASATRWKFGE